MRLQVCCARSLWDLKFRLVVHLGFDEPAALRVVEIIRNREQ